MKDNRNKRMTAEDRKATFLEAAGSIIRERGVQALTMEGLAAHCGVNKALPYRHFTNSDDVLVALYEKETEQFDARLAERLDGLKGFKPKLQALVQTWYDDVINGTGTPELQQTRTESGELEARRAVRIQIAVDFIADLIQESHEISRADAKLAASVLLAGSQGLSAIWGKSQSDDKKLIASFITMSIGAVKAISKR